MQRNILPCPKITIFIRKSNSALWLHLKPQLKQFSISSSMLLKISQSQKSPPTSIPWDCIKQVSTFDSFLMSKIQQNFNIMIIRRHLSYFKLPRKIKHKIEKQKKNFCIMFTWCITEGLKCREICGGHHYRK